MRFSTSIMTLVGVSFVSLFAPPAQAGDNDVTLQRFGECRVQGNSSCAEVITDDDGFYAFARDFGLVFSPPLGTTAETLGPAGFAVQVDQTFSVIDASEDHWEAANINGDPNGTMALTSLRVRKGLPLSLELGGNVSVLWDSELVAVGADLRWALHEDFLWPVPDLAIRGYVNTVIGHSQLQVTTAGAELVAGLPIGLGNIANLTPYAGYNLGIVVMSSRLIDKTPNDPRPPVDGNPVSQPEFVFPVKTEVVHQGVAGLRFQFAVANLGFQAQFSSTVQNYTLTFGFEF